MRKFDSIEQATRSVQGKEHQPELQSIRGLAAMVVVLHHCSFYYRYDATTKYFAEVLLNAHGAVVVFFVLSGYVLCRSLMPEAPDRTAIIAFYMRRAFRIYPALWLGVLLAFAYAVLFHAAPLPATIETWWWQDTRRLLPVHARDYLMTVAGMSTDWPLPLWTLKVELLASLVLPLLAWALIRSPVAVLVVTVAASAFVALWPGQLGLMVDYFPSFLIGSLIVPLALVRTHRSWPDRVWQILAGLGVVILMFSRHVFVADYRYHYMATPAIITEATGGMLIIAAVTFRQHAFAWLRKPGLVWLGDISYSLYIVHMPILGLVAGIAAEWLHVPVFQNGGLTASLALTVCVIVLTFPAAALSYRYIELPGIRLGKTLGKRILKAAKGSRVSAMPGPSNNTK